MVQRISQQLATMSSPADEFARAVTNRGRIVINPDMLAAHAASILNKRFARTVDTRLVNSKVE